MEKGGARRFDDAYVSTWISGVASLLATGGGRYTWQLSEPERLVICWRAEQEPRKVEQELIRAFRSQRGARRFANLKD